MLERKQYSKVDEVEDKAVEIIEKVAKDSSRDDHWHIKNLCKEMYYKLSHKMSSKMLIAIENFIKNK
jgi:hypothetical protein